MRCRGAKPSQPEILWEGLQPRCLSLQASGQKPLPQQLRCDLRGSPLRRHAARDRHGGAQAMRIAVLAAVLATWAPLARADAAALHGVLDLRLTSLGNETN